MRPVVAIIAVALFFALMLGGASAVEKTGPGVRAPVSQLKALTESECHALGGGVTDNATSHQVCGSGKMCSTQDEKGKWHDVCISKK